MGGEIGSHESLPWAVPPRTLSQRYVPSHFFRDMIRVATAAAILLAGMTDRLPAQTGTIRGHVVRADGPIGLADADVELLPSGARTRTDARGFFLFRDVAESTAELAVRRVGFAPAIVALQVSSLAVTEVEIPLERLPLILDPIVTSVTRDERSLSEVGAAVSVADTSAIRRGQTVGLNETLRMMPGVQASSRYGGMEDVRIGIRGSASRGGVAPRGIAVLLDGIPLTETDGVARLDLIELAASRQVEVVRGPVSALYAGSPGGVVNVVSRTGRDSPGIAARALTGAFGFQKYDGHAGGVFARGRGSGFLAASYTSANGYRAHSDGDVVRGQVAFDYVAGPGTRIALQANGSRLDSRLPGPQSQLQFDADPDAAAPAAYTFGLGRGDNRYRAGARLEQAVGNGMASGYFFYGGRTLDFPITGSIVDLNLHRVQSGARLRTDGVAGLPLNASIGVDYDNIFSPDRRWENNGGVRGALRETGYFSVPNLGVHSQVEWWAARTAGVTVGLRYDRVTYRFESSMPGGTPRQERTFDYISPRLSALWSPHPATSVHASVGRGVEVPAIGELSAGPANPILSVRPKSLWNYEVGARHIVGDRVLLDGSVFYADVRGEFVPRTVLGTSRPENASRSRNIGVEFAARARVSNRLDLSVTYTLLDLRLLDYTSAVPDSSGTLQDSNFRGKLLPGVPRHRLTGETRVSPLPALDIGVQLEWQSIVYVESGNARSGVWYFRPPPGAPVQQVPFRAVPARTLVHLNGAWSLGPATVFGSVENLFGLRYTGTIVANESFGRFYEAGPPASVSIGLNLRA
jgi:iron complex outermembrane recepter protein